MTANRSVVGSSTFSQRPSRALETRLARGPPACPRPEQTAQNPVDARRCGHSTYLSWLRCFRRTVCFLDPYSCTPRPRHYTNLRAIPDPAGGLLCRDHRPGPPSWVLARLWIACRDVGPPGRPAARTRWSSPRSPSAGRLRRRGVGSRGRTEPPQRAGIGAAVRTEPSADEPGWLARTI
jgi:hypothetical protein